MDSDARSICSRLMAQGVRLPLDVAAGNEAAVARFASRVVNDESPEFQQLRRLLRPKKPRSDSKPRWVSNEDRSRATLALAAKIPSSVTAVAGVPRSGLAPAMQVAELLHLHPYIVSPGGPVTPVPHGWRFKDARADDGLLVVIDDTVASGKAMRKLQLHDGEIRRDRIYAVTYASPENAHLVDVFAESLSLPHYLEWNFFNSIFSQHTALDFDGILCRDCLPEEDDDGPRYRRFLESAEPKYLPRRRPVPLIVTARLEKYRADTEAWMAKWGVRFERLVMGPWETVERRRAEYSAAEFKGRHYADSSQTIFVESCPVQAKEIADYSGKRVICPGTAEVHN